MRTSAFLGDHYRHPTIPQIAVRSEQASSAYSPLLHLPILDFAQQANLDI